MSKAEIMNKLTRTIHKTGFKIKKHSPEILIVAGVAGVVTSTVMACKATTKLSGILDEAKENIDKIHEVTEHPGVLPAGTEYTVEDSKKDLAIIYTQTGLKLIKLYAPSVALGVLSIAAIVSSNNIMRKRNVALAAAYATVDKSFKEYRGRVIDRFGKDLDRELRYNIKAQEVEEIVTDENGEEKVVKKTVEVAELQEHSDYARFYDDGCTGWSKSPEHNLLFLKQTQAWFNRKLQEDGIVFLNDIYGYLGLPKTKQGHIVGWVYDPSDPSRDNYIDFGIYDMYRKDSEARRNFVNGYERTILLDFNVDGDVWSLLK